MLKVFFIWTHSDITGRKFYHSKSCFADEQYPELMVNFYKMTIYTGLEKHNFWA